MTPPERTSMARARMSNPSASPTAGTPQMTPPERTSVRARRSSPSASPTAGGRPGGAAQAADDAVPRHSATARPREEVPAGDEAPPYVWLFEQPSNPQATGSSSKVSTRSLGGHVVGWAPFRRGDARKLERALEKLQRQGRRASPPDLAEEAAANVVSVECGRYDVDLRTRTIHAVYWDEPDRRVIRSLWFYGHAGERRPYEELDSKLIEEGLNRLRSGKERAPLLVPVWQNRYDVRFELMSAPVESSSSFPEVSPLSFFMGTSRSSLTGFIGGTGEQAWAEEGSGLEPQYSVVQESVGREDSEPNLPVWRGYFGDDEEIPEDEEESLPSRVSVLAFVVHGIGQYHQTQKGCQERFHGEVAEIRGLGVRRMVTRIQEGLPLPGRVEFLPLEWFESIHIDVGIGDRLKDVTLPSIPALRDWANFSISDIMVYLDDEWRNRIHEEILDKMNRIYTLFKRRTKEFDGEVVVCGHSLGSVIMFDLIHTLLPNPVSGLQAEVPQAPNGNGGDRDREGKTNQGRFLRDRPQGCPVPRILFGIGSPLGMFLSIRLSRRGSEATSYFRGLDVCWPQAKAEQGWRFYNVFHPDDPIAYRLEPLLNPEYAMVPSKVVPYRGGWRLHNQVREWWRSVGTSQSNEGDDDMTSNDCVFVPSDTDAKWSPLRKPVRPDADRAAAAAASEPYRAQPTRLAVDRIDWALQESAFESMNELLSALHSHFQYWQNEDVFNFVVDRSLDACAGPEKVPEEAF